MCDLCWLPELNLELWLESPLKHFFWSNTLPNAADEEVQFVLMQVTVKSCI